MNPIYENIQPNLGSSFYTTISIPGCAEPFWHIHPEYELVYINKGSSIRHIGNNISKYVDGDLLLIGPNIPHSNLGNKQHSDNFEVVIQMSPDLVENKLLLFPEFKHLQQVFSNSKHGISFGKSTKLSIQAHIKEIVDLEGFDKLLKLLEILNLLSKSNDYTLLHTQSATVRIKSNDYGRINLINEFVASNYSKQIQAKDLANLTGLTESSFSRFFKKTTGKTFSSFLSEYKIQKACALLSDLDVPISVVMEKTGFLDPAHFSRIFKKYTKFSPSEYRKAVRKPFID